MSPLVDFMTSLLVGLLAACAFAIAIWLSVVGYLVVGPLWLAMRQAAAVLWNLAPVRAVRIWFMQREAERCRRDARYRYEQGWADLGHELMCKAWSLEMRIRGLR